MWLKCLLASNVIGGMLCIGLALWSIADIGVDFAAVDQTAMWLFGGFAILFGGAQLIYGSGD